MIDSEFKIQVAGDLATIKEKTSNICEQLPNFMTKDACMAEHNKSKGLNKIFSLGTLISVVAIAISLIAATWRT